MSVLGEASTPRGGDASPNTPATPSGVLEHVDFKRAGDGWMVRCRMGWARVENGYCTACGAGISHRFKSEATASQSSCAGGS